MIEATTAGDLGAESRRAGRFRRLVARTLDWTLVVAVCAFAFSSRAVDAVQSSAIGSGRRAVGTAMQEHAVDWDTAAGLVSNADLEAVKHVVAQFVLALLVGAFSYEVLLTLLVGTTLGKALMLARVRRHADGAAPGRPGLAALATRSFLAVVPGGAALTSWLLWLAGWHLSATVALFLGGSFLLVDGLVHLATARPVHDRMTGATVVGMRRPRGRRRDARDRQVVGAIA